MAEKYSSINKVIGSVEDEDRIRVDAAAEHVFRADELPESIKSLEVEMSPVQQRLTRLANRLTNVFLETYGYPTINVGERNVHVLAPQYWRDNLAGRFVTFDQNAYVKDRGTSTTFMEDTTHELLHLKSYGALQADPGIISDYRLGLSSWSRDRRSLYLNNLSEALIEKCTMSVMRSTKDPAILAEKEITEAIIREYSPEFQYSDGRLVPPTEILQVRTRQDGSGNLSLFPETHSYPEQRLVFDLLVDKIFKANKGFVSKKEIMGLFMDGMFNGDLLGLGRLVDRSFGTGAFRRIGESDSQSPDLNLGTQRLRQAVESL